jgi:tRNA 2-thiouridine synthesizing protein E
METGILRVNDGEIEVDNEGYLLNPDDWDLIVANSIADKINVDMTDHHWEAVNYVRDYFDNNDAVPEFRPCLKFLNAKLGGDIVNRKFAYKLFPYDYGNKSVKLPQYVNR